MSKDKGVLVAGVIEEARCILECLGLRSTV